MSNDLDREVGELLQRLPDRRAPHTLRARVMVAVRAIEVRPWYRRPWSMWPVAAQVAALALASVTVGLAAFALAPPIDVVNQWVFGWRTPVLSSATVATPASVDRAMRWAQVTFTVWRTVVAPFAFWAAAFSILIGTVLAATALSSTRVLAPARDRHAGW